MIFLISLALSSLCLSQISIQDASSFNVTSTFDANPMSQYTYFESFKGSNKKRQIRYIKTQIDTDEITYSNDRLKRIDSVFVNDIYVLITDDALKFHKNKKAKTTKQENVYYSNRQQQRDYSLEEFMGQNIILSISDFFSENFLCDLNEKLLLDDSNCKKMLDYSSGDKRVVTRVFARRISSHISLAKIRLLKENFKSHYRIDSPIDPSKESLKSIIIISNSFLLNVFKLFFSELNISLMVIDIEKFFNHAGTNLNSYLTVKNVRVKFITS